MDNQEIAKILNEISIYLDMDAVPFKPRAYEKVAETVSELSEEVKDIYTKGGLKALEAIPGVGASIAEKVEELLKTGHSRYYDGLRKKTPIRLGDFQGIEGVGSKTLKTLYEKLGIRGLRDLEKAIASGRIRNLKGFGVKSEENILKGIEFLKKSGGRFILGLAMPKIREIESRFRAIKGVEKAVAAGSVRRRKETIGDADILVIIKENQPASAKATAGKIMDYFVNMPEVARVFARGETKSAVKLKNGLDVDVRVVPAESYGAALNYFTGSKEHNIALREIAIKKGWKLNEYGLFENQKSKIKNQNDDSKLKMIGGENEEELYKLLGLRWIEPELREHMGEIEAARENKLPKLIGYKDVKGDLQ